MVDPTFTAAFHDHFTRNPNRCVALGIDQRLDELPDPSLAEADATVGEARRLIDRLDAIDRSNLDFDGDLDLGLARLMLEEEVLHETYAFNGRTMRQQRPSVGDDVGDGIFRMFTTDPRPAGDRLANITNRLEQVPDYIESSLARLDTPVERWVAIDREEAGGLPEFFASIVDWARQESWPDVDGDS